MWNLPALFVILTYNELLYRTEFLVAPLESFIPSQKIFCEVWKFHLLSLSIFSRLHGSYEQLWAGQVSEALVDLTGGLAEHWSLGDFGSEDEQKPKQDSDQVRRRRLDLKCLYPVKDECALSCSTHSSPGGQNSVSLRIMQSFDPV